MKRRALLLLGAVALATALTAALVQLFTLRFQQGDVYPPYSTLRADPLGAKALHDALAEVGGFDVQRNFRPLTQRRPGQPITLIYAGIQRRSVWGEEEIQTFEGLVTHGARAVFAFAPEDLGAAAPPPPVLGGTPNKSAPAPPLPAPPAPPALDPLPVPPESSEKPTATPATTPATTPAATPDEPVDLREFLLPEGVKFKDRLRRWGAAFAIPRGKAGAAFDRRAVATAAAAGLEPEITWHTALYFKDLAPVWRTLYTCEGKPVVIERPFGDGTIVLASDAYFLSNEALRRERAPRLLASLVGPPRTVVFDEEHHGVTEQANVASLVRKYRLQGVLVGLALLAALFVWKHAVPLVPQRRDPRRDEPEVLGKDAQEGFINLLRRSIPAGRVLEACVEEWEKTGGQRVREAEIEHVRSVLRAHRARSGRDAVMGYRTIAEGLSPNARLTRAGERKAPEKAK